MQKKYLEAGEIVSTHGVQGEVKILPWADGPEFLLQFDTFYLDGRPYAVRSARVHKTCVLASLEGIDTPEQGMALRGKRVCIDRDEAKLPEGSVFIADLIGCRALDEDGAELGRIEDVLTCRRATSMSSRVRSATWSRPSGNSSAKFALTRAMCACT